MASLHDAACRGAPPHHKYERWRSQAVKRRRGNDDARRGRPSEGAFAAWRQSLRSSARSASGAGAMATDAPQPQAAVWLGLLNTKPL